jgi:hypothetical protein
MKGTLVESQAGGEQPSSLPSPSLSGGIEGTEPALAITGGEVFASKGSTALGVKFETTSRPGSPGTRERPAGNWPGSGAQAMGGPPAPDGAEETSITDREPPLPFPPPQEPPS